MGRELVERMGNAGSGQGAEMEAAGRDLKREQLRGMDFSAASQHLAPVQQRAEGAGARGGREGTGATPAGGRAAAGDARAVVSAAIGRGQRDENEITNEAFWRSRPELRGVKLRSGSPEAAAWLRIRDDVVRPMLADAPEPDRVTPETGDGPAPAAKEADRGKSKKKQDKARAASKPAPTIHAGAAGEVSQHMAGDKNEKQREDGEGGRSAVPRQSGQAAVDALLAWQPVELEGPDGQAAWLLAAIKSGMLGAASQTQKQLGDLSKGKSKVISREKEPDKVRSPLKNVKKVKRGVYEVNVGKAPIVGVLVAMATNRMRDWVSKGGGKPRQLFVLGTMARGDLGFPFESKHAKGAAIDIHFADDDKSFKNDKDVSELLESLEPGKVGSVFPDNNDHVHLGIEDGKYQFGLPFQGDFFPLKDSIEVKRRAALREKPVGKEGEKMTVKGLVKYKANTGKWVGTYKDGRWNWPEKPTADGGPARPYLKSSVIKGLLNKLGAGGGDGAASAAASQDGDTGFATETKGDAPMKDDKHDPAKCGADCGHIH